MATFEVFKKRMVPLVKQPYVTIQKRGTMSFNKSAHMALGEPETVELLYDPNERIIGVRAIDPDVEHADERRGEQLWHAAGQLQPTDSFRLRRGARDRHKSVG